MLRRLLCLIILISAAAQTQALAQVRPPLLNKSEAFGTLAGAAEACGLGRPLDKFEHIAAQIIINSSSSVAEEEHFLRAYARAKMAGAQRQRTAPPMSCNAFERQFMAQEIMSFTAFPDGSIRKADGTWILPRGQTRPPRVRGE